MRFSTLALSCIAAAALFSGCGDEKHPSIQTPPSHSPEVATIVPEYGTFGTQISATASIQPSPDGIVSLSAPAAGSVEAIHATVGERVSSGSPLLNIRSADVSDVQSDLLSAKAAHTQAKHLYEMNRELFKLGAISANELSSSKTNMQQAEAMEKGFSQKLNYFGATSNQSLTLRSPISGVVYEIATHLGEKVGSGVEEPLIRIADPRKKMIVATVYEKDLFAFTKGKEVQIRVENQDLPAITGKVSYVSDVLDPENKTTKIYIEPSGDTEGLKINMFVTVTTEADKPNVFRIPKTSLLYQEGKFVVYTKQANQFVPMNVTLISDDPQDNYSLIKGLRPNTPIAKEAIALERQ